jgi:hypothetical protein
MKLKAAHVPDCADDLTVVLESSCTLYVSPAQVGSGVTRPLSQTPQYGSI